MTLERHTTGPGLLVSVRCAEEAAAALAGGATWIDVKEPALGSLGRAALAALGATVREVRGRAPVSAALGELTDADGVPDELLALRGVCAWKAGPAGLDGVAWSGRWRRLRERLRAVADESAELVAVAYADHAAAGAPEPFELLDLARRAGARTVLIDTCRKGGGDVFSALRAGELQRWVSRARAAGLRSVVAGSLREAAIGRAALLGADLVAVRGAATEGARSAPVTRTAVARCVELLSSGAAADEGASTTDDPQSVAG